jgi:hypothetical protein
LIVAWVVWSLTSPMKAWFGPIRAGQRPVRECRNRSGEQQGGLGERQEPGTELAQHWYLHDKPVPG